MKWKKYKDPKEYKEKFPKTKSKKIKLIIEEIEALDMAKIDQEKRKLFWCHIKEKVRCSTGIVLDIDTTTLCDKGLTDLQIRQLIIELLHQEFFIKPVDREKVWATVIAVLTAVGTVLASVIAIILAAKS